MGRALLMASFTVLRIGAAQAAMNDPRSARCWRRRRAGAEDRCAEVSEGGDGARAEYKKQLTDALVELAQVQEELDK
jgi:hypothetical protein